MLSLLTIYFLIVSVMTISNVAGEKRIFGSHHLTAYVTDWALPHVIPWGKLDHVAYAFAVPDKHGNLGHFNADQLRSVVTQAHEHNKGCSISVGGWTGSVYFSSLVRTSANRERFANNLVNFVEQYKVNGINLDWEYPNANNGISCNQVHPDDTDNFLVFVQLLRAKLDKKYPNEHKVITAAVATSVFNGKDQKPLTTLNNNWSKVVDYFYVMAYDMHGISDETTGANAPLGGEGVTGVSAIKSWAAAGVPHGQLVLGVPFYGYVTLIDRKARSTGSTKLPLASNKVQIAGDKYDSPEKEPCPGATHGVYSGEYQWRSIKKEQIRDDHGGWRSSWDQATHTPYSVNIAEHKFLSFDDAKSLNIKAEFADELGLHGVMLWSLEMDDDKFSLLEALQSVRED